MASSFKGLEDLELTRDEVERIGNALKKEEFRKLLVEYVEEIQDPENRKIYEQEITQLEKERGVNVTFINPVAGYVIKTSVNGNKKGFVNICANENIQKPTSTPGVHEGSRGLQWSLPHTLTPPREDIDNKGLRCVVYDVCFHPDTLHLASKNKAFRNMVNNTACEAIETNFDVKLDKKNLKFPKMQYKGNPTAAVIRKPSGEKPIERDPESQKLYDQIYAQADERMNKSTKKSKKCKSPHKKVDLDPVYTAPKYIIKHRSHIEMEEFTEDKNAKINSAIPKELVIEINLPLLKSANEIMLDVTEKTVQLISEKPAKYKLFLTLPYQVNQDTGNAKFDKDMKKLIITLPVKRTTHFVCDDSGVESDHNSPQPDSPISEICEEELVAKPEISSDRTTVVNHFLDENEEYLLPEFSCHLFDNIIAFTLHVKNVDESSIKKIIDEAKSSLHIKFTSISSGFYPNHYAFYVVLKKPSLVDADDVTVEVWDNNVILQFAIKSCDKSISSYLVGVDENSTTEKFIEEPSVINHVMKEEALNAVIEENGNNETKPAQESETNTVSESTSDEKTEEVALNNNEKYTSKAIDIIGNYSESSGDELSYSYSPSRNKGILKRLTSRSVSRSVSESSIDDYVVASSFENCHTSVDSVIPEDGEVSTSLKKTVRFNSVVSRQLYRLDSSILGQKKKNQRKARNKKRALERRHSESEASEVEDKKEGEKKTSSISLDKILDSNSCNEERKEQQDIFHFDMN